QHGTDALRGREHRVGHRTRHLVAGPADQPFELRVHERLVFGEIRRDRDHRGGRSNTSMYWYLRNVSRDRSTRPAARARAMTTSGSGRSSIAGPGPPPVFLKSTIPTSPVGFSDF